MSKKALLVVSFGTSFEEALPAIVNIEEHCKKAFPDYDFLRAFTSGIIIQKLKRTKNMDIYNPQEAMEYLAGKGYEEVICQSTHMIRGMEYEKMIRMLLPYKERIPSIFIGNPLLSDEEDYKKACQIVMNERQEPLGEKEAFVLMGHGVEHFSNSAYCQFENMLRNLGYENTYVATLKGFPSLDSVISRLKMRNIRKVCLMPLLVVAGNHARNDLAGTGESSWNSLLQAEGFQTEVILKGLGEIDAIAQMFVEHLKQAKAENVMEENNRERYRK